MYIKTKPLTQEQSDFAAEKHNLIYGFLNLHGYSADDYYDVAVFGFLHAVTIYHEREDLRKFAFSTIAYQCMRSSMSSHFKSESIRIRDAISFDEYDYNISANDGITPELVLLEKECLNELIYLDEHRELVAA